MAEFPQRPTYIWIPIAISTASLIVAGFAALFAWQAKNDTRAIARLDLRPMLELRAEFRTIQDVPPHFRVTNTGPVDAVQLEIELSWLRYSDKARKIYARSWGGYGLTRIIPRLSYRETKAFKFRESWLNTNARLAERPEHNVMEILLTYRREPDRKQFKQRAFYFVNPKGRWVGEDNSSLTPDIYDPIKRAALNSIGQLEYFGLGRSDPLH